MRYRNAGPPRVVDLFAGAGGMSLGFRAAGCDVVAAVDVDSVAGETFRCNFTTLQPQRPPLVLSGEEYSLEDVTFLQRLDLTPPDIVVGGPPCQGFSRVGRGKLDSLSDEGFEDDPRNQLYRSFVSMIAHWRPRAVVIENVPGMLSVKGVDYATRIASELAAVGYTVGYAVLNAVWYGIPQFRERLFFIGYRQDLGIQPVAPVATHIITLPDGYHRPLRQRQETLFDAMGLADHEGEVPVPFVPSPLPAVTVGEALEDMPILTDHLTGVGLNRGDFRTTLKYCGNPVSEYARLMRDWPHLPPPEHFVDHVVRRTPRDYETFRRMRPGDRYPQAHRIACERFDEELHRLHALGVAPPDGSTECATLRDRFVPPYPLTIFEDKWRKHVRDQPSWTVPAHLSKDSYSHIHYDDSQARMISVREAARLQSFPDGFVFCGNMGDCFRQVGNAVPPILAWAIGTTVMRALGHEASPPDSGNRDDRDAVRETGGLR